MLNENKTTANITAERRMFIEQLKANTNDLYSDSYNTADLLHSIVMFKDGLNENFQYQLKSVFNIAIKSDPCNANDHFNVYSDIMQLMLSLLSNSDLIERKCNEYKSLSDDLYTMDHL